MDHPKKPISRKYAIPFFAVLIILSGISFAIPLRPQVSYLEKRELHPFPAFSVESFLSGDYFSELDLWFSDTFPGRENWLDLSNTLSGFHGYGDFAIQGSRPVPAAAETASLATAQLEDTFTEETTPSAYANSPEPTEALIPTEELTEPETAAPTEAPTVPETTAPTEEPTVPETTAPTEASTVPETTAPTEAPAVPETTAATEEPAVPETTVPTEEPTVPETTAPTEAPAVPETTAPSEEPTVPETTAPTEAPAVPETTAATEEPTVPETTAPSEAPTVPETTAATEEPAVPEAASAEAPVEEAALPETVPPSSYTVDEKLLAEMTVNGASVVQMGDTVFYPVNFSSIYCNLYIQSLNTLVANTAGRGIRIVSAVAPTAVGIIVPDEYLSSIGSYPQSDILKYLKEGFSEEIIAVDTVSPLKAHLGEYLYFHSDHHWTATAAYYCYRAICEAMELEPAELDEFTEMDQGRFIGSIYLKASNAKKLARDHVLTYDPIGNISMTIIDSTNFEAPAKIVRDMRNLDENSKYLAFIQGDQPRIHIQNDDLPDGRNCLIIKDSFGNCLIPFFAKNYHNVYAMDYRKCPISLSYMIKQYDIQDIIFAPNMMSIQSEVGTDLLRALCS